MPIIAPETLPALWQAPIFYPHTGVRTGPCPARLPRRQFQPSFSLYTTEMKHYSRTLLALAAVALLAQGCKDKANENTVNVRTSGGVGAPKINYTIQVVDAPGNSIANPLAGGRTSAIVGASVRYINAAGAATTKATDATGAIQITDAAPGTFSGQFSATGYAMMSFTADLNPPTNILGDSGRSYNATTRLYAIRNNAVVIGNVYGNYNAPTTLPPVNSPLDPYHRPVALKIIYELSHTGTNAYPMGSGAGRLTDISLDANTRAFRTLDAGSFEQDDAIATQSGFLSATLSMSPYTVNVPSGSYSFVLSPSNAINLDLSSGDTLQLGYLLTRPR